MIRMEDPRVETKRERSRRAREAVVRFVALLAVTSLISVAALYSWSFMSCFSEAKLVPELGEYPLVRVLFYGSGRGSVSARFSLYDTAGREFSVIDRSWSAQSLSIDFTTATFSGRTFVFPYRIRPSEAEHGGTRLSHYYLDRRQCMLLGSPCTPRQKLAMFRLAVFALSATTKVESRFSTVQSVNLAQCAMGRTYDILVGADGTLRLVAL